MTSIPPTRGGGYDPGMNPFTYGRSTSGVSLGTHFVRTGSLGWECGDEQEVDRLVEHVRSLLDETAVNMKAALKLAVEE